MRCDDMLRVCFADARRPALCQGLSPQTLWTAWQGSKGNRTLAAVKRALRQHISEGLPQDSGEVRKLLAWVPHPAPHGSQ